MQLYGSLALIWVIVSLTAAAQHGTIGYGITMFRPWCCTACYDTLSTLYLNCTTFPSHSKRGDDPTNLRTRAMNTDSAGSTSDRCRASDASYQESFAYCIKSHCDAEGMSYEKQDECFRQHATWGSRTKSLIQTLPVLSPTEELAEHARWLNKTMLVNEANWKSDRRTIEAYEKSEEDHVTISMVGMLIGVGIPMLTGLYALARGTVSAKFLQSKPVVAFQSSFALPALFNQRHAQALPGKFGYLPTRPITAFVALYIIMNVVFSGIPFHSVQPNTWFDNRNQEISAYVGNRTGVLSFTNMALAILFSTRNNPLISLCGWSPTTFITLHRWTARMAIIHAIVHSLVYSIDYSLYYPGNDYDKNITKSYFWWGIIATIAMALMGGISSLPFRAYAYEFFLFLHIILALLALVGSWYHVELRFAGKWGYEVWLYIAFAIWAYDRMIRVAKVVYYNVLSESTAEVKMVPGTKFAMLTVRIKKQWSVRPGMYTFVYFPSLGRFWENHPFTIADWGFEEQNPNGASGRIETTTVPASLTEIQARQGQGIAAAAPPIEGNEKEFYIRCIFRILDGTTAKLYRKLSLHPLSQSHVMTEGPYGGHMLSHYSLRTAEKVLCIAGGIGITFAAGFVRQFSQEHERHESGRRRSIDHPVVGTNPSKKMMPCCRQFTLAWSVREQALLDLVRQELLPDLKMGGLDDGSMKYRIWLTKKQLGAGQHLSRSLSSAKTRAAHATVTQVEEHVSLEKGHRINVAELLSSYMEADRRHVVLVCGPGALADEVRQQVVQCSRKGYAIDLIEESFAW